jgi:hypothetical protein
MKICSGTRQLLLVTALVGVAMTACAANQDTQPTDTTMSLNVLHSSSQCGQVTDHQWINSQDDLDKAFRASRGAFMSPGASQSPTVDFDKYGVVLLTMGQQRTGGYAIKLTSDELAVEDSVATLRIQWQEPQPGMMVTQALTQPCVFIQVPRGSYQTLRAVDQNGKVRAELTAN